MWNLLPALLFAAILHMTHAKLVGDHVCQSKITEPVEFTEWFLRNRSVRNYEWCWNVPPRCSTYSTKLLNETRIIIKNVTRSVEQCCEGFQVLDNKCVSLCPDCVNGICKNGECLCSPGWKGAMCDSQCLVGQWGSNCTHQEKSYCNCLKYIHCHAKDSNDCDCVTGWLPDDCSDPCPKPFFGQNCSEMCKCNLESNNCFTDDNECISMFHHHISSPSSKENIRSDTTDVIQSSPSVGKFTEESTLVVDLFDQLELQNDNFLTTSTRISNDVTESPDSNQKVYATEYDFLENIRTSSALPTFFPIQKMNNIKIFTEKVTHHRNHENQTVVPESKIFRVKILSTSKQRSNEKDNADENLDILGNKDTSKDSMEIQPKTEDTRDVEIHVSTKVVMNHTKGKIPDPDINLNLETSIEKHNRNDDLSATKVPAPEIGLSIGKNIGNIKKDDDLFASEDISDYEKDVKNDLILESLKTSLDVHKENVDDRTRTDRRDRSKDEERNYLVVENLDHNMYANHNRIIQYVSIVAIVTLIVITISVGLLVLKNIKKSKKHRKRGNVTSSSTSTVAVYTTSIFHTPLPDPPPTFENPTYLRPDEYQNNCNMRSFQAEVVCNMNFKKPSVKEIREYTYDYPPSTGSYRATSTIDAVSEVDISQKLGQLEPLYDEIPSREQMPLELQVMQCDKMYSHNNNSDKQPKNLYMNTSESTRF